MGVTIHGQGADHAAAALARALFLSGLYAKSWSVPTTEHLPAKASATVMFDKAPFADRWLGEADFLLVGNGVPAAPLLKTAKERATFIVAGEKPALPKGRRLAVRTVDAAAIAAELKQPVYAPLLGAFAKYFNKITLRNLRHATGTAYPAVEAGFKRAR